MPPGGEGGGEELVLVSTTLHYQKVTPLETVAQTVQIKKQSILKNGIKEECGILMLSREKWCESGNH